MEEFYIPRIVGWDVQYYDSITTQYLNYIEMFDENNGIAMGDGIQWPIDPPIFLLTTNGGESWSSVNHSAIGTYSSTNRTDFINLNVGYFNADYEGLYKTSDGCSSWVLTNYPEDNEICNLEAYSQSTCYAYGYAPGTCPPDMKIYFTFDSGVTWDSTDVPDESWGCDIEFCPDDSSKLWLATREGIYFSSNGGVDFDTQMVLEDCRDIHFLDENHGWLLADEGVFRTTNGGVGTTGFSNETLKTLSEYILLQNYPNPFNPTTKINYSIPRDTRVEIIVYDILGRKLKTLIDKNHTPGNYHLEFNGYDLASGVYIYQIKTNEGIISKKMVLLK